MNPFQQFVTLFSDALQQGKSYSLGNFPPLPRPQIAPDAPKALFFAPHPDDECIVGGLALRLMREAGMNVINVAVTQGRKPERMIERFRELQNACYFLGFGLVPTRPNGLDRAQPKTREQEPTLWSDYVRIIADILTQHQPRVIFFPHEQDWNTTHIGTHWLVMDALKLMPGAFETYLVETEFWGQMGDPNLMVEISTADLADLVTATTFHVGEVQRNPYHLLLPAWMMDNVRRGAELVGGQGAAAPDFTFATLYRLSKWSQGRVAQVLAADRKVSRAENVGALFL